MNPFRLFLCGGAILIMGLTLASADEKPRAQRPRQAEGQPRRPGLAGGDLVPAGIVEKLKLTAEQKEKFDKLSQEFQQKHKDAQAKLEDARKNGDRAKYKETIQAQEQVRAEALAKLKGLLTDAQKKSFEETRREKPPVRPGAEGGRGGFVPGQLLPPPLQERLKLTDDQKKKLNELQKDVDSKIQNLLTEEQRKLLGEVKKPTPRVRPQP